MPGVGRSHDESGASTLLVCQGSLLAPPRCSSFGSALETHNRLAPTVTLLAPTVSAWWQLRRWLRPTHTRGSKSATPHIEGRLTADQAPVLGLADLGRNRRAFVWFSVLRFGLRTQHSNSTPIGDRGAKPRGGSDEDELNIEPPTPCQ